MSITYDKKTNIWYAESKECIYSDKISLGQIIYQQLQNFPNNVIQIDDTHNTQVTGQQALSWGIRIAQHLGNLQLGENDVVSIAANNTTYVLPAALGCLFNGTPIHTVNPRLDLDTISHCLGITKPKLIFCGGENYELLQKATSSFKPLIYTLTGHIKNISKVEDLLEVTETENSFRPVKLSGGFKQTVAILCSSGTTGKPKAICISSALFLFNDWLNTNDSVLYISSGIDWITGIFFLFSSCLRGFTRVIFSKGFEAGHFLEILKKYHITTAFLSSRYVAALVQHPGVSREALKQLQVVAFGGSALSEVNSEKLIELCTETARISFCYGSTEMGPISQRLEKRKCNSVGKLFNNTQLAIISDEGHHLGPNEVGEIVVKVPYPWIGYYGNPIETAKAMDSNGWFHSGDLGYVDDENDLFIVDRKKEILKYRGLQFSTNEIEGVIAELEGVRDVCVVSLFNEADGDLAGALVVLSEGSTLKEKDVVEYVKKRLVSPHKHLNGGAYFVDKLPQNQNGKLIKKEASKLLKRLALNQN
ncbi:probable 4-coumarate--CoA ligase 1 isoform X2 [Musca autumnalis]|uniref:probable 4-coumarate--CoA ligase 1 isoform X2 n=1 Tax=Musca autumnalis TaxID=221902 RepID=UPI003CF9025A